MKKTKMNELLYEALETEKGGIKIYETAIRCAKRSDLKKEWEKYHDETRNHERILIDVFQDLGLDPDEETPGRKVVRLIGESFVKAMELALKEGNKESAELVAAECVVMAEYKDHSNWQLIGMLSEEVGGSVAKTLKEAYDKVEDEEDEHLYHTMGWAREMHIDALGLEAVFPPPEESKEVKSAIGQARANMKREKEVKKG